ncbi:polymer-forming cytoskeletal protein [Halomonas sp. McH1-25]|uniref:bactofilin family protein n=1 Tax=unclassified Halomonas TaxID=2609666 RepID=UPI001EF4CFB9|nr:MULTISPECIES: polymer-forming cytoskeletal protein [unclassified Halomonas]MCG7598238.1 polymer-forming cytoskeletal protein [Halomonas sp. McH1-25]MCP1340979.1 polymer-forming cytoskeletal protein [Halomonas sp. FL8]MCP1361463.1 polymer-forming cytoskeletal protein [Halomonas sp. BBD45]MCP1367314.1 polymer-forming cytoskeletal protein [Halomonas sp. BBD48]
MFSKHKPASDPADQAATPPARPQRASSADELRGSGVRPSIIGANTRVEGSVIGEEELIIDGQITGTVEFKRNGVSIGSTGRVEGDIYAQTLHVAGRVEGRLIASKKVTVHRSAHIVGSIITPCLALEDGAVFRGDIDMNSENEVLVAAFDKVDSAAPAQTVMREDEASTPIDQEETLAETDMTREDKA